MEPEEQDQDQKFVLQAGDDKFILEQQFSQISGLAQFSQQAWGFDENGECKIEINQQMSDKDIIQDIVQWVKEHEYKPPHVQQIQSDSLSSNLGNNGINVNFLKKFESKKIEELKKYYDIAEYLQINDLKKVLVAKMATKLYFGKSEQDFVKMQQKLKVNEQLTVEEEEQILKTFEWIQKY